MTIDLQKDTLKFLAQSPKAKTLITGVVQKAFDLPEDQFIFSLIQTYWEMYSKPPSRMALMDLFETETEGKDIKAKTVAQVRLGISRLFDEIEDEDFTLTRLVEQVKAKLSLEMFRRFTRQVMDGEDVIADVLKEIDRIANISNQLEETVSVSLIHDNGTSVLDNREPIPTFILALNRMTSAGGFMAPELIILMGPPKSFKTGTALCIALNMVKMGYKVYWADFENGANAILTRSKQQYLECTEGELKQWDNISTEHGLSLRECWRSMIEYTGMIGGDFRVGEFRAHLNTLSDVEYDLDKLAEIGWVPDVIFYDYLDLARSSNPKITEKRLVIQDVYHHAIRINSDRGTVAFSFSQVKQKALNKEVITVGDFPEDFGKAANAHAAFAICRTEQEIEMGTARIVPVMQRRGVKYRPGMEAIVFIDEARMLIKEIDNRTGPNNEDVEDN